MHRVHTFKQIQVCVCVRVQVSSIHIYVFVRLLLRLKRLGILSEICNKPEEFDNSQSHRGEQSSPANASSG